MRPLLIALAITMVAGCASTQSRSALQEIKEARSQVDDALAALRQGNQERDSSNIRVVEDEMFAPPEPMLLNADKELPGGCEITYAPRFGMSIKAFGQYVTRTCGIPVLVTQDAMTATAGGGTHSQAGAALPAGPAPSPTSAFASAGIPLPAGISLPAPVTGGAPLQLSGGMGGDLVDVSYKGQLSGLLDAATARLGLSWRYRSGRITIFFTETRFYKVYALPKAQTIKSTTSSGSTMTAGVSTTGIGGGSTTSTGAGSDASTSSITTADEISIDPSKDVREAVQSLLTPGIGRMSFAPSTGTITVTDTPDRLQIVEDWVASENNFRTKFVLLNVELITVKLNNSNELGVDWNLAYKSIANQYGLGLVSSYNAASNAIAGSINVLEGSSRFSGSEAVIKALAQQGEIVNKRTPSTSTLNMKSVSVQLGTQTGYIQQASSTQTTDVGVTQSLTPGQVTAGFNMTLVPYIQPDNKTVLLSLAINMTDLIGLEKVDEKTPVQTPNLAKQIVNQEVKLKSGQTLVLSGLDTVTLQDTRSGVGRPWFFLFGGGKKTSREREVLVALVTPIVKE
ncbi:type IVB pilus formation R64 PilN family outer membrane protein [Stenotrophomonas sp. PvP086]|nr:PilN family type IVB pilus formation outer membrane protein [Stenotrophomonas maltophilia]